MLVVGRGRRADIRVRDKSVSRLHAELVLGGDGTLHVADRSSANGTWIEAEGRWRRLTQRTVTSADRLRLGDVEIEIKELLRRAPPRTTGGAGDRDEESGRSGNRNTDDLPRGPVRRNPETGEVIAD